MLLGDLNSQNKHTMYTFLSCRQAHCQLRLNAISLLELFVHSLALVATSRPLFHAVQPQAREECLLQLNSRKSYKWPWVWWENWLCPVLGPEWGPKVLPKGWGRRAGRWRLEAQLGDQGFTPWVGQALGLMWGRGPPPQCSPSSLVLVGPALELDLGL